MRAEHPCVTEREAAGEGEGEGRVGGPFTPHGCLGPPVRSGWWAGLPVAKTPAASQPFFPPPAGGRSDQISRPAGHRPLPAKGPASPPCPPPPPHPTHCPLTSSSGQTHQGQDGPEAGPGPRLGTAQAKHLRAPPLSSLEGQRSPDHCAHIPPPYIGFSTRDGAPLPGQLPSPHAASAEDWWKLAPVVAQATT